MAQSTGLHWGYTGCCRHRCRYRGNFQDSWCLWFWSCRHHRCSRQRLWQLCRLDGCRQWCRNARSGWSLWCDCSDIWCGVSGLDTVFTEVSSHAAVDHAITGAHLVAVFQQDTYHSGRDPDLMEGVIHHNWLAGIQGARDLHHLSACDLEALEWASICSRIWKTAGLVLQILAGMMVLIWCWYRSSAGDGSLAKGQAMGQHRCT